MQRLLLRQSIRIQVTAGCLFMLLICSIPVLAQQKASPPQKIKALIVAGQDGNHWFRGSSAAVKQILENSGLFTADVIITPEENEDISTFNPDFKKYNLVITLYGGKIWSEPTRKAFENYVANGGGFVVLHSSIVPMEAWEEYNKMIGLGAWNGRNEKWGPYVYWKDNKYIYDYSPGGAGHHALQHPFTLVNRATEHPILKGLPTVWRHTKDELYGQLRGPAQNMEILATSYDSVSLGGLGRDEPIMWTVKYGRGKVFVDVMGHAGNDPNLSYSMECAGYQITLLRGCEWVATGKVTQSVPKDFPTETVTTLRKDFRAPFNAK